MLSLDESIKLITSTNRNLELVPEECDEKKKCEQMLQKNSDFNELCKVDTLIII